MVSVILLLTATIFGMVASTGVNVENTSPRTAYNTWIKTFRPNLRSNKGLRSTASLTRFQIFQKNFKFITELLKNHPSYHATLNKFADMTDDEMEAYTGTNATEFTRSMPHQPLGSTPNLQTAPAEIDHRMTTGLNLPRDIGFTNCKAAWAFSTVALVESRYIITTGEKSLLSEQEILDCTYAGNVHGCAGGSANLALSYVKKDLRLADRRSYQYSGTPESCRRNNYRNGIPKARITSFYVINTGDSNLVNEVANNGPVSVVFHSPRSLKFYHYGVYDAYGCWGKDPNHGAVVVGYRPDRWIVRNSWGVNWGMSGNFYLTRKEQNMCKISSYPVTATMVKTNIADDRCEDVPIYHRQPCWEQGAYADSRSRCESTGCCYDPTATSNKCFVKGKITLYTEKNFGGVAATFYGSVDSLREYDLSKATVSMIVHYGHFIAYEKDNFGEEGGHSLYVLSMGRYKDLYRYDFAFKIKSIRALPGQDVVSIFKDTSGRGEMLSIYSGTYNVGDKWNDEASSIYSERQVDVCKHSSYQDCQRYSTGLTSIMKCNDCLSSVKIVY